ncbi:MAG: hypothetical protein Q8K79_07585 [Solirubrobacteraceae bacterium]|nr:hypothetical protein [Solirubrobacteraceae bacterium]
MKTAEILVLVVAVIGVGLTAGGLLVTVREHAWARRREAERRSSSIVIGAAERSGLGSGDPVVGETRHREHVLVVDAQNHAETPAYVRAVWLEPEQQAPLRVFLHREGVQEVQPGNSEQFVVALDGSQAFPWDQSFRIVVKLANGAEFASPYAQLDYPPHHGQRFVVPDIDEVPAEQVHVLRADDLLRERRDTRL